MQVQVNVNVETIQRHFHYAGSIHSGVNIRQCICCLCMSSAACFVGAGHIKFQYAGALIFPCQCWLVCCAACSEHWPHCTPLTGYTAAGWHGDRRFAIVLLWRDVDVACGTRSTHCFIASICACHATDLVHICIHNTWHTP